MGGRGAAPKFGLGVSPDPAPRGPGFDPQIDAEGFRTNGGAVPGAGLFTPAAPPAAEDDAALAAERAADPAPAADGHRHRPGQAESGAHTRRRARRSAE